MLKKYVTARRISIILFFLFTGLLTAILMLYRLPSAAVWYALALCGASGIVVLIWDCRSFVSRHRCLEQMRQEMWVTLDHLPETENLVEEDYQEMLRLMFADKQEQTAAMESRYQELTDYYTTWVHQIKTPIAAMGLMLQGGDFPEARELREELRQIDQYVEMVLCYLRLDAGSTDYVIKEYDLDEILRQAVRSYASVFIRKKLRLEYEPLCCRVVTDEKWLLFVIGQILSNALKYTKSGSIRISLEAPKTLCIADTGIGIAPEDLPRIFEKGYTGCNGRKDKKASGIGLYLSRRICRNLGHEITITSVPGQGTEVRLDLKNADLEIE